MSPRRTVRVVEPPAEAPLLLSEIKAWIKIDAVDDDALLDGLMQAACEAAESSRAARC
jgi:hypothetical protein